MNGDVRSIAAVLAHLEADDRAWRSSRTIGDCERSPTDSGDGDRNDRRDRQCGRGGLSEDDAKTVVRRVDEHGLHRRYEADATGLTRGGSRHPSDKSRFDGKADSCLHVNLY